MIRNLYYQIKPLIPRSIRLQLRSRLATKKRDRVRDTWPIAPGSEHPPKGWPGWPQNKAFAVVLTHDVEGQHGLDQCRALMQIERAKGFRSSFNFVPEGEYRVSAELRTELQGEGFEVGVHDLHHDGKLFRSKRAFMVKAARINQHLSDWGAVGFRAGFMLHNLEWFHQLNVAYDASTFDTDPFEPQPDGVHTIFPFWVPRSKAEAQTASDGATNSRTGYVELPYTLPQDSTVFLLLAERQPRIWIQKLDWVAQHGGMVLVNVHPDYIAMRGERRDRWHFPAAVYEELLDHIRSKYAGNYWLALPREVAEWVSMHALAGDHPEPAQRGAP
jgi:hypothetical protein